MVIFLILLGLGASIELFAALAVVLFPILVSALMVYGLIEAIKHGKWLWVLILIVLLL